MFEFSPINVEMIFLVRHFGGFSNIVSRVDFFFNCVQQPFSLPLYQSRSLLKMKIDSSTCMTFWSLDVFHWIKMMECIFVKMNGRMAAPPERVKKGGKRVQSAPSTPTTFSRVVGCTNWVLNTSIVLPFLWWGRWQMWKSKRGQISGKHVRARQRPR